ncbi:heterokaryon incompatibility, partial [Tricladium varicosporioides]
LKINQRVINIRENLYSAMKYLRREGSEIILWVDALCINQGDTLERTQQVKQMGTVYKKARKVLAWLGNPADSSGEVMRYRASRGERELDLENSTEFSKYFDSFCSREYWTRVWVIQEVVLAKELVL